MRAWCFSRSVNLAYMFWFSDAQCSPLSFHVGESASVILSLTLD